MAAFTAETCLSQNGCGTNDTWRGVSDRGDLTVSRPLLGLSESRRGMSSGRMPKSPIRDTLRRQEWSNASGPTFCERLSG
eukprot:5166751-Pyramimonas_sp.AAC.1